MPFDRDPDATELSRAEAALEAAVRRRDTHARLIADAAAAHDPVGPLAREEYAAARRAVGRAQQRWREAFDAWSRSVTDR